MNEELKATMYISRTHTSKSHMWNSETLGHYLSFLRDELKRRRLELNLPFSAKALILCDAAAVHSATMWEKLRLRFEKEANAILLHGGGGGGQDRVVIPGGWGATGAPNDAWHQWFHYLRRGYMRLCTGTAASLKLRREFSQFDLSVDGNAKFQCLELHNKSCLSERPNALRYSIGFWLLNECSICTVCS